MQIGYIAEDPLGYEQITNLAAAVPLTSIPAGTSLVIIQAEAQAIRWRDDGVNPTSTVGMTIPAGQELQYSGSRPGSLRLIAATAGAIANISYYAQRRG